MTISNSAASQTFAGNGVTTAFSFSFIAVSVNNLVVQYTAANGTQSFLTLNVDYTVTLNAPAAGQLWGVGGTVNYPINGAALPSGASLTVSRLLPVEQLYTISNQGDFYAQVVERALDTLCLEIAQTALVATHALTYNAADPGPFQSLPIGAAARANQFVYFDSDGNLTVAQAVTAGAVISAAMQPVCAAATIAAAVTLLGIDISLAMEPVVAASTIVAAVKLLGLSLGTIIPCTATISGTSISLTRNSFTNGVAAEALGVNFAFTMPSGGTGPFSISEPPDGLSGGTLVDSLGNDILSLAAGQYCVIGWNPVTSTWVLIGFTQPAASGYAQVVSTLSWTVPTGITEIFVTAAAGGGGGGWCGGGTNPGGGGGGGGEYTLAQSIAVIPGHVINFVVGSGGAGAVSGTPGASGGNTTITDATASNVLLTLVGGGPGGNNGGGGGSATAPALAGQNGDYFSGLGFATGGFGGNSLNTGGSGAVPAGTGQIGTRGAGGGGGCESGNGAYGGQGTIEFWWGQT